MQYTQHAGLPDPDEASAAHSRRVVEYIAGKIREAGANISFAEFMQHALYAPGLGYYVAGSTKFGEAGDFITAPEVSSVFGHVVARQCVEVLVVEIRQLSAAESDSTVVSNSRFSRLDMMATPWSPMVPLTSTASPTWASTTSMLNRSASMENASSRIAAIASSTP